MTRRLRLLWRTATLGALLALSAAPGAPQDQGTQTPVRPPRERPGAGAGRTPGMRRGYTSGREPRPGTPPLPGPTAAGQPTPPGPPGPAGTPAPQPPPAARPTPPPPAAPSARPSATPQTPPSPTAPPNKLSVVQGRGGGKEMVMEVYDLDLDHLLRLLSDAAGVTITKTEAVKGKVTIIAPDPVPLDVAFQILDSVLQMRGYAMIRDGSGIYKIMPMNEAAQAGPPLNFGSNPEEIPDTSQLITQVVPLRNLSADDVAADISSLLSSGMGGGGGQQGGGSFTARVVPTTTNALIITDTSANIKRVLTIIADMEQQLSGGYKVFRLQYYDAETMANVINSLILSRGAGGGAVPTAGRRQPWEQRVAQGGRPGQPGPQRPQPQMPNAGTAAMSGSEFVFPDTKTQSLVVQATPTHLQQIAELVDQLDRPVNLRDSFVVYPVQNLIASDLAQRVGQHLGITVNVSEAGGTGAGSTANRGGRGGYTGTGGRGSYNNRGNTPYRSGITGTTPYGPGGGTNMYRGLSVPDAMEPSNSNPVEVEPLAAPSTRAADPMQIAQAPEGAMPVPAAPPAPVGGPDVVVGGGDDGGVVSPSGSGAQAVITADDNTNTILVTGPPEQADLIRAMLEKLDVVPPQVYIQAIIAEVILSNDQTLGFEWSNLMASLNHNGQQFHGIFDSNFGTKPDANGNLVRTISTGLSGFITGPDNFAALLTALAQSQNIRVLSTPSIFTSNNEAGNITVANAIPFPTTTLTSTAGTGTGVTPVIQTGVDYQNVGIVLDVTPRITQGDIVHLDVMVSANDVGDPISVGGQSFPTTRDREAQAILSIKDGYTVVLGGLMRDSVSRTASKVPILGEIPLIGALFRSSRTHVEKSELLVFLTPRIVRTPGEAARVSEEEKCKLQEIPRSLQPPSAPLQVPAAPVQPAPAAPPTQ